MEENRSIRLIAHLFFLVMLLFAANFAVARMLFADGSFYLFKMTCSGHFNIEAGRYAAFLTQIIPVSLIHLHASLKTVILGYSMSFIIVYYVFFLISLHGFFSLKSAVASTLMLVLGVSDSSMYPISEMQLGIMSSVLFYGFTEYYFSHETGFSPLKKAWMLIIGALLILLCMFSHPSSLFLVLFILAFQAVDKRLIKNRMLVGFLLLVVVVYAAKFLSISRNSYEGHQLAPAISMFTTLRHLPSVYSVHFFIKYIFKGIYVLPLVLLGVNIVFYLHRRAYGKLAFQFISFAGFFLVMMVLYAPGDSDAGMEKNLLPLWFYVAIPFVHDLLLGTASWWRWRPVLYGIILVCGLAGFNRAASIYTSRLDYLKTIMAKASADTGMRKFIILKRNVQMDRLVSTWSIANESLLLSSLNGPQNSMAVYLVDDLKELGRYDLQARDVFLSVSFWLQWRYPMLNSHYFRLPEEMYTIWPVQTPSQKP